VSISLSALLQRLLKLRQDLTRATQSRGGQAGETRDVYAVGAVGLARQDLVQEDDLVPVFANGDVVVTDAFE
jgi:hypothetical protein